MLATVPLAPSPTIMRSSSEHMYRALADPLAPSSIQFKKHKTLPRPPNDHDFHPENTESRHASDTYRLVIDPSYALSSSVSHSSPSSTVRHSSQRPASSTFAAAGLDLPPTPPAHSRASSSTGLPTSQQHPSPTAEPVNLLHPPPPISLRKPPVTPPDQRSPPTPDVTPPQPQTALKAVRQPTLEHSTPGVTPTDSRNDSFKTAQEEQFSSEDDYANNTLRSRSTSAQTSQTTILRVPVTSIDAPPRPQPLEAAKDVPRTPQPFTPRTMDEFRRFDGAWDTSRQLERDRWQEREQDSSMPQPVVSKRKRPIPKTQIFTSSPSSQRDVVEDNIITPTAAARAARHVQLRDNAVLDVSPVSSSVRSASETSASVDARRSSATSARSSSSAVVEVVVMGGPAHPTQRRRTLRHVKKQNMLRQPPVDRTSGGSFDSHRRLPQPQRPRRESPSRDRTRPPNTQTTASALGDRRARREIWNNGGIPVVVVPDRRSSHRSQSREPSLRSTSSRRSRRSASVGSPQRPRGSLDVSQANSSHTRGRTSTVTHGERTMDFAPTIPPRSSSLSATTSRNASRATSLTTESIRAHNAMQQNGNPARGERHLDEACPRIAPPSAPASTAPSPEKSTDARFSQDSGTDKYHTEDALSSKRYTARNTPFSVASVATTGTGTVPEVSEAVALQLYPHQNSSVLMVDHSGRRPDSQVLPNEDMLSQLVPAITTTDADGEPPATPPERLTKTNNVDSPLRNPRAPPQPPIQPPMLNLIPATPSGATPSHESLRKLGNFFESSPPRRPSLIRRAFSHRRRNSVDYPPTSSKPPGRLTRSFSLTRSLGLSSESRSRPVFETDIDGEVSPRRTRKEPTEQEKLHPYWRPQDQESECEYGDSCPHHSKRDTVYRYPLVDNRPRQPKRSLSARVKNTFAILPAREETGSPVEEGIWPERRTIRRTPSGNLRVMQRRASMDSEPMTPRLFRGQTEPRPPTSDQGRSHFWRGGTTLRRAETENSGLPARRNRRFSLSDKLEEFPSLPRILNEKRREKRTQELRQMISGPTQVRDGVGEVIRRGNTWGSPEAVKANPSDF